MFKKSLRLEPSHPISGKNLVTLVIHEECLAKVHMFFLNSMGNSGKKMPALPVLVTEEKSDV